MVTFEALNSLFQFGILIATTFTAIVAVLTLVINRKKK